MKIHLIRSIFTIININILNALNKSSISNGMWINLNFIVAAAVVVAIVVFFLSNLNKHFVKLIGLLMGKLLCLHVHFHPIGKLQQPVQFIEVIRFDNFMCGSRILCLQL